ncbi:hypothetical protein U1Q18_027259 [Sarracenia purpurea var. burkii]
MIVLRELDLPSNNFNSIIPDWLYSLSRLEFLDLSVNKFHGTISSAIGNLTSIIDLNLAFNNIQDRLPKSMGKLCNLRIIDFSGFKLEVLEVTELLSRCISDGLEALRLEGNQISGQLADVIDRLGEFKHLTSLSLANNSFSGSIPESLGRLASLKQLQLNSNELTGALPVSLGRLTMLEELRLSGNELDGVLSEDHFENLTRLSIIDVSGNPMVIFSLSIYATTACLKNYPYLYRIVQSCTELIGADLGENELFGSIPNWMGEKLPKLKVLNLRSNRFSDHIPFALCALAYLQILDLTYNNLSGTIPKCFNNFSIMATDLSLSNNVFYTIFFLDTFEEEVLLVMKGKMLEYSTTLHLVAYLDLSDNHLSGDIPSELTSLLGLRSLNLSRNQLSGKIPKEIGKMKLLESIDLSVNELSGEIPQTMSSLTFLSFLNLSHNNMSGRIPSSPPLQSFNGSSFVGNHLCEPPLDENCGMSGELPSVRNVVEDADGLEVDWFYVTIALGFVAGFWDRCGPLLFNKGWRFVYFDFLDRIGHKLWSC